MTSLDLYLITRLDYIQKTMEFCFAIILMCIIVQVVFYLISIESLGNYNAEETNNATKKFKRKMKFTVPILAVILLLKISIPSTKEMFAFIIVPKITNSKIAQQLPKDVEDLYAKVKTHLDFLLEKKSLEDKK